MRNGYVFPPLFYSLYAAAADDITSALPNPAAVLLAALRQKSEQSPLAFADNGCL